MSTESKSDEHGLVNDRVGKSGCVVIKKVLGCGPYVYHVTKHKGKQTWHYLGRADKFGLVNDKVGKSRKPDTDTINTMEIDANEY